METNIQKEGKSVYGLLFFPSMDMAKKMRQIMWHCWLNITMQFYFRDLSDIVMKFHFFFFYALQVDEVQHSFDSVSMRKHTL